MEGQGSDNNQNGYNAVQNNGNQQVGLQEQGKLSSGNEHREENLQILPQIPLTEERKEKLINIAKKYKQELDKFQNQRISDSMKVGQSNYVISLRWLRRFQAFVSYEEVINQRPPSRFMGGPDLDYFNYDITDDNFQPLFQYIKPFEYLNSKLKPGLLENVDYKIISFNLMRFFYNYFIQKNINKSLIVNNYKIIERIVYKSGNDLRVQVHPRLLTYYYVDNDELFNIDPTIQKKDNLMKYEIQVSSFFSIKEWYENLEKSMKQNFQKNLTSLNQVLRIWRLNPDTTFDEFLKNAQVTLQQTPNRDYQIEFDGSYVEQDSELQYDELNILPDEIFFFEAKLYNTPWCFQNEKMPLQEQCQNCNQFKILKFQCVCNKAAYCTENCRERDKYYHTQKCEKAGEEDQQRLQGLVENEQSKLGVVGLKNLGNTCFMNSALQSLTQTQELVEYFLAKQYKDELNLTNRIGSGGQVAQAFANLVIKMYLDVNSEIAPYEFQRAIGSFQTMFSGYSQHDSHELNMYVLDAIHEDLNRIKDKISVENQDSDGRADFIVAKEYWENFQKRNDSIIVDTMFGQSKSKLECPDCKKISISFDPFLALSLPIPQDQSKKIVFFVLKNSPAQSYTQLEMPYKKNQNYQIADLKNDIAKKLSLEAKDLYLALTSRYYTQTDPTDESSVNQIRKKFVQKYRHLVCRELRDWEKSVPVDNRVSTVVRFTYSSYYQYETSRKQLGDYIRSYIFDNRSTLQSIHLYLFSMYKGYFTEFLGPMEGQTEEQIYQQVFLAPQEQKDKHPWRIMITTNAQSWYYSCYFCGEKRCDNCPFPYKDDVTLGDLISQIPQSSTYQFQIEVFVRKINGGRDTEQMFEAEPASYELEQQAIEKTNAQKKIEEEEQNTGAQQSNIAAPNQPENVKVNTNELKQFGNEEDQDSGLNIYRCLESNREPEKLEQDNAWYCSNCKDHKEATKLLEIYKAPKVLIIHLKRFKGQTSYYRQKQTALVEFPLEGLNLTQYVLNKNLPANYDIEAQLLNEKGQAMEIQTLNSQDSVNDAKLILEQNQLIYDLYGVSNHSGSLGGGHYTAYVKNYQTGQWYDHNDSSTREIDSQIVVSESAYMLFYRRRDI